MKHFSNCQLRLPRWEYTTLIAAVLAFVFSLIALASRFYKENTVKVPGSGGTYIEGSVGEFRPINPWFTVSNDVNRDMVSLIFAGLLKYNPETNEIENDLAEVTVSADSRIYTAKLKDNIFWHDSSKAEPHPVTPEDVIFTFKTIQDPEFPNTLLRQNYLGVEIEQIDGRTVRFKLEEPYVFFKSNLTLGLLPKKSFDGVPKAKLDQALDFGFNPVGAGPYAFKSFIQTDLSSEVTLEYFPRDLDENFHIERVIFRIFPDYNSLLSDIRNLNGVRHVPRNENNNPIIPRQFNAVNYTLPQYVALFFNLDRAVLSDRNLRLGLQLGTNKQEIIDAIGETKIVDTPLLEIDAQDWRYKFDVSAAQGALFTSDWYLPEKIRLQRLLEMREANSAGSLKIDNIVLLDTGAILTATGKTADFKIGSMLNGNPISIHPSSSGSWIAAIATHGGTGSLALGQNLLRMHDGKGNIFDSAYVWRTSDPDEFKRASAEQNLLELFVLSRDGKLTPERTITARDLYVEKGMLRRRTSADPFDVRVNSKGEKLSLTFVTSSSPPQYKAIAELIKRQWKTLGVDVSIVIPPTRSEFEERMLKRDYDMLLFGQSLLDNLDSYPYWHNSGAQKLTSDSDLRLDAYNLSQYSSMKADVLLELIRQTAGENERIKYLEELREIIKTDVPAIFLYSPLYTFAYVKELNGVKVKNLSLHSDRLLSIGEWFLKHERDFLPGKSWWSFPIWLIRLF